MTDINASLAELAANAEERRAALEVENEALRSMLEGVNAFDAMVAEARIVRLEEALRVAIAEREDMERAHDALLLLAEAAGVDL